jgi:N-acetylglutamate synthase-like GNAT family acetyltransferase
MLSIELLADHPEAIPILTQLFEAQWEPYYGSAGPGNALEDLMNSANRRHLPIAMVAIDDGAVCGTAALKNESVSNYPDLSPWLAALVVAPAYRNRGVGERLITRIEQLAEELGFREIYVGTGENSGMSQATLNRRGWKFLEKSDYFVSEVRVYQKRLSD